MKVFLINLDRDKDRLAAVTAQLNRLGVKFERVSGVYGKELSGAERAKAVNGFRWWCAVGRKPTDGEIGCALSHASVYRRMLDENIPLACVLEDDVVLDERFPVVLREIENNRTTLNREVLLLSNHSDADGQLGDVNSGYRSAAGLMDVSYKESRGDFFAECYVLNSVTAKTIMEQNSPMIVPCDWWGRWSRLGALKLYHVFPTVAGQSKGGFASNTLPGCAKPVASLPLPKFLWHKCKRLIGLTIDRTLSAIWSR